MKKVLGYGPDRAKIMIVGEAPGQTEVEQGKPFVGKAGNVLRKCLGMVGIDPDDIYLTNICKYRPPNNRLRAWITESGAPTQIIVEGLVELAGEIRRIQPNVIVACGNFPLQALTGKARWIKTKDKKGNAEMNYAGISDWRGSVLECTLVQGFKVVATYHPSFIMREGFEHQGIFIADLERVKRESESREIQRPQKDLILDPQGSDRIFVRDRLLGDSTAILTCDIEYTGNKLLCVGLTNSRDWATSIAMRNDSDLAFARECLLSGLGINMQNALFDASILEWHYNIPVFGNLVHDTMAAAHAANPELPKALDFLCSVYTDQPFYKHMVDWKLIQKGKQPIETVLHYNAIDVWVQHEIMEEQWKWDLNEPEVLNTFRFEMAMMLPLWEMSKRGVRIDKARLKAYDDQLTEEIEELSDMLLVVAGRPINVKSGPQVWELFKKLGLKPTRMNKTGPAADDKTLAELQLAATSKQSAVLQWVRDIRKKRDLKSKFLNVQFDEDGRMRGHYSTFTTVTGRLASKKFYPTGTGGNQQNIPRDKLVRSMFIPDQPDHDPPRVQRRKLFVYADLERAESLVVAKITQDPAMLADHMPGVNAHRRLGVELFGKAEEAITDDEYYLSKKTRHAGNYMQGPITMMRSINQDAAKTGVAVTFSDCKRFINIYRERSPFLKRWWQNTSDQLWMTHTLYNLVGPNGKGRKRIFHGRVDSILPEAVAYVPQSTVGDALNVGLLNLQGIPCYYTEYLGCWDQLREWAAELQDCGFEALLQVHDAVGFQIDEDKPDVALPLVEKLMSVPLTVPHTMETFTIPVEIAVGPSWGEVKIWKPQALVTV